MVLISDIKTQVSMEGHTGGRSSRKQTSEVTFEGFEDTACVASDEQRSVRL